MKSVNKNAIINTTTDRVIASELRVADSFLTRLKGLIGSKPLVQDQGLLISPCQQIHTHFMSYPIDVVFLDNQLKVIHLIKQMKPWRFSKFYKDAYYVLELPADSSHAIAMNDEMKVIQLD